MMRLNHQEEDVEEEECIEKEDVEEEGDKEDVQEEDQGEDVEEEEDVCTITVAVKLILN